MAKKLTRIETFVMTAPFWQRFIVFLVCVAVVVLLAHTAVWLFPSLVYHPKR